MPRLSRIAALRLSVTLVVTIALIIEFHVDQLTVDQLVSARAHGVVLPLWVWAMIALVVLIAPLAGGLALALVWRIVPRPDSRALAMLLADMTLLRAGDRWPALHDTWPVALHDSAHAASIVAWILLLPALVHFTLVFPAPLDADRIRASGGLRYFVALRAALSRGRTLVAATIGTAVLFIAAGMGLAALRHADANSIRPDRVIQPMLAVVTLIVLVVAVENLRSSLRGADAGARRRAYWVLEGFVAGTFVLAVGSVVKLVLMLEHLQTTVDWYGLAIVASWATLLVCVAIAMFFAGALDAGLAIRRTAVVGLVGILMVFVFTAVESLVGEHLQAWIGLSDRVGAMLTGGVVALTIGPIERRVSRMVEEVVARLGRREVIVIKDQPHDGIAVQAAS